MKMNLFLSAIIFWRRADGTAERRKIIFCKGGGCTAKLGAGILSRVLERLPKGPADENLLIGYDSKDDAAVYRISDDTAIVQTLDFFRRWWMIHTLLVKLLRQMRSVISMRWAAR